MAGDEPERPDDVPKYVLDPLDRQDADTLHRVQEYLEARASWLRERERTPPAPEEIVDDQEPLEESEAIEPEDLSEDVQEELDALEVPGVTIQKQKRNCGKNCDGCPHGPYLYAYYREGTTLKSKYLGAADDE